jgi:DNA-directed RNA polymerase specialized sigma subunit
MTTLPTVKLSESELEACLAIMRKGNKNLKLLAEDLGMEQRAFRIKLFKKSFKASDWPGITDNQAAAIVAAIPSIQAVRSIEYKMLCGHAPLARKHALSFGKRNYGGVCEIDDFYQEALMAVLDAIYSYTEETAFTTFAWHAITRRLTTAANKANPFTPLTNEAMKLVRLFDKTANSFNGKVSDDEVYAKMNITESELAVLKDARRKIINGSQIVQEGEESSVVDYTEGRCGIDGERDTVPCNYELYEAIDRAGLTELEREVILCTMYPYYGWQADLAKNTHNPKTGRPYSRMTINNVLKSALDKVKKAYSRKEVA